MNILQNLIRDIVLMLKNLPYLGQMGNSTPEDEEDHHKIARHCPKNPPTSLFHTIYHFLIPRIRIGDHTPIWMAPEHNQKHDNDNIEIFLINGVLTSQNKCMHQTHYLSYILKHRVNGLYNPTNGIFLDVLESFFGRTLNLREPITKSFEKIIREHLIKRDKVILIGHSQGAIVISHIVKLLKKDKEAQPLLHKLEIYTFGSGSDEMPITPYPATHFANTGDFVARIGILGCADTTHGIIANANKPGHSFERCYLVGFMNGDYGKDSNLYQRYMKY